MRILLIAGLLAAQAAPAAAQGCASREAVVARLAERYGETRQAVGLSANRTLVEVFASASTGTWTITVTVPGGPTCLLATGEAFEAVAEPLPPAGAPA